MRPNHIEQIDRYHFKVKWPDGLTKLFRLSDLQRACPCSRCKLTPPCVPKDRLASRLLFTGHFGVRIFFTEGCSKGIYSWNFLRGATL